MLLTLLIIRSIWATKLNCFRAPPTDGFSEQYELNSAIVPDVRLRRISHDPPLGYAQSTLVQFEDALRNNPSVNPERLIALTEGMLYRTTRATILPDGGFEAIATKVEWNSLKRRVVPKMTNDVRIELSGTREYMQREDGRAHSVLPHYIYDYLFNTGFFGPTFNHFSFSDDLFSPQSPRVPALRALAFRRMWRVSAFVAAKRDIHYRRKFKSKRVLRVLHAFEITIGQNERLVTVNDNRGFATVDTFFVLNKDYHWQRKRDGGREGTPYLWGPEFYSLCLNSVSALKKIHDMGYVHGGITRDSLLLRRGIRPNTVAVMLRGLSRARRRKDLPPHVAERIHPMYIPGTAEKDAFDLYLVLMELHGFFTPAMKEFRNKLLSTEQYLMSKGPRRNPVDMLSSWDEYHLSILHEIPWWHASAWDADTVFSNWRPTPWSESEPGWDASWVKVPEVSLVPWSTPLDLHGVIKFLRAARPSEISPADVPALERSYAFAEQGMSKGLEGVTYSFFNYEWMKKTLAGMVEAIQASGSTNVAQRAAAFADYPKNDIIVIGKELLKVPSWRVLSREVEHQALLPLRNVLERFIEEER